jgi:Uma2 family endonuclease/vacuolar-type H+-ATPase subunit H
MVYELTPRPDRWELRDEDNVPDSVLQDEDVRELVDVLAHRVATEHLDASVGSNLAVRWDPKHPTVGVDPDVYLVEPALSPDTTSLRLWEPGRKPLRLAVEIVSQRTADTDYLDKPERYAANGTRELWIFDPLGFGPSVDAYGGPYRLQVWRRVAKGRFKRIFAGDGPAYSRELAAWIVVTGDGRRLRIAEDRAGTRLWPTAAEAERQAREVAEKERDAERQAREAAEKAREAAEKQAKRARSKARKVARDAAFETMCGLYAQRLRRALTDTEREVLRERLAELGPDRVGEALFTLDATALAAWLASPGTPTT